VLLLPAAWAAGRLKEHHWETLVCARAIESTCYVVAADQVGPDTVGRSMIVDPMGLAVAAAGEAETVVVADLDPGRVQAVRDVVPSLRHRRPDVYESWAAAG
jgi:predicted amidohydrolase